ncbi:hypothetical protein QCA50_003838 [Cerrena zonata]|uniref:Pre-mRNA-splicing factor CWC24 n=1 Tax=Cerrena zonata TaxID=2478898 RepID=A0AAW0GRM9_9APHY
MASTEINVPFFKKKGKGRPTTSRKRSVSPTTSAVAVPVPSSSKSEVVLPSKKFVGNLLSAGTKRSASQRERDDMDNERRKDGPDVKWSAEGSHSNAVLEILAGDEAEEELRKRQKKSSAEDEDVPDDGLYRGQKGYRTHIKKSSEIPKAMRVGPQRSSTSTIRTVTIVDYQPDVCKDYKETGFCGYGDTCKFLHDRGTYLAGWQLDKLAANPQNQQLDESDSDSDDDDIPFACLICRKPYTDPIVTRCGHYFDSACAIKRFAKTPKCAACGAPTAGIFNRADKVIDKMRKKREEKDAEGDGDDGDAPAKGLVQIEGLGSHSDGEQEGSEDD